MSESGSEDIAGRVARLEQQDERLTQALELLAARAATPAAKPGRDWDAYAAVIASFIGLLALAVAGYTAYVQRQQLRAQVWPRIQLEYSTMPPRFMAINQGTGPARITAVRVAVDGVAKKSWDGVAKAADAAGERPMIRSSLNKSVLPAGRDFTIVSPAEDAPSQARFMALLPGGKHAVSITVCYCSVLDECWVTTLDTAPEDSQRTCPITAAETFQD